MLGPENSLAAKNTAPETIRAQFGKDSLRNAIHSSDNLEQAKYEINYFFN
jgi:nucleoside diphosphate kinase